MKTHSMNIASGPNPRPFTMAATMSTIPTMSALARTAGPTSAPPALVRTDSSESLPGTPVTQHNLEPLLQAARSNGMFSSLSEPDARLVLSYCHFSFVESDVRLFDAGEQADFLLFIVDGRVNVTCDISNDQELRVGTASIGAIIGESAITSISQRNATATTASRCALGYLYYKDFSRLCSARPEIALRFLVMMFNQLSARMQAMTRQLTESANRVCSAAETTTDLLSKALFDRRVGAPRQAAEGTHYTERRVQPDSHGSRRTKAWRTA